jgi:hypothetical protein
MSQELRLVRKAFCSKRGLKDLSASAFVYQRVNRITGNHIFLAAPPDGMPEMYEHPRVDVTALSLQKSLWIPKDMQSSRDVLLSKGHIASWVNRQINLELLPEDISKLVLGDKQITVVTAPNSMRFRNSFILYFQ